MEKEIWEDLKDFNGFYSISNLGRIKSNHRIVKIGNNERIINCKILKPIILSNGYYAVNLTYPKRKQYLIHRLVMKQFYGPSNLKVNHKNFDKSNNCINNLEYCTQKENIIHSILGGKNGRILLNVNTGIFYITYNDAINSLHNKISIDSFYKMMCGKMKNKTNFIKV